MKHADLLIEIGTEELPPKALSNLMRAFASGLEAGLDEARLEHGTVTAFASPRRLAVIVEALAAGQPDRSASQKGPPVRIAFDDDGKPTAAATAFAGKCGVSVDALERTTTDKGEWLSYERVEAGQPAASLLEGLVSKALAELPIPRRMRWGSGDVEFVRPVHWVVALHGGKLVEMTIMGVAAGKYSRGHRVHCPKPLLITSPGKYLETLEQKGYVIADFERRQGLVREGVETAAADAGGSVVADDALFDEVTALVEWPVPVPGKFDDRFLELPREVVVSTLTGHQRYFPVADQDGALLPLFVTVANLDSEDPDQVRDGNERVIRPRLADAAFFWDNDRQKTLGSRETALREVVYQQGLGSLFDKSSRTAALAKKIAAALALGDEETAQIERAAMLSKCDLLTGMVGEFPDLQGLMGQYYAAADGEADAVATAIGEQYLPRFAGDRLPATTAGQLLAIADKLDTLCGVFAIGKAPKGNRDPFGLRRAALGVVRIAIECRLDIDLQALIEDAVENNTRRGKPDAELVLDIESFLRERLRSYFLGRDEDTSKQAIDAVLGALEFIERRSFTLTDIDSRLGAVRSFVALPEAENLAAAHKRIKNILRKAAEETAAAGPVSDKRLADDAEKALYAALLEAERAVRPMIEARQYTAALTALAALRGPVDRFFDEVMVMADDAPLRRNRLSLLRDIRDLFDEIADISHLVID